MDSRGLRNNNPFNIRYSPNNQWMGKISVKNKLDKSFEEFSSITLGIRAGLLLIASYIYKGYNTPRKIIERFAPSSENDTAAYIDFVTIQFESDIHLKADTKIGVASVYMFELCRRMMFYESRYLTTFESVLNISESYHLFKQ